MPRSSHKVVDRPVSSSKRTLWSSKVIVSLFVAVLAFFASAASALHSDTTEALSRLPEGQRQSLLKAERQLNDTLLWGSYRPQNYFGFRPRLPASLVMGLAWADVSGYEKGLAHLRHQCDDGQGVVYKWTRHDGAKFGEQSIRDESANVEFTTSFIKNLPTESPDITVFNESAPYETVANGGSWAIRVSGKAIDVKRPSQVSFFTYFGTEGEHTKLVLESEEDEAGTGIPWTEGVHLSGNGLGLGEFDVKIKHTSADALKADQSVKEATHNQPMRYGNRLESFKHKLQHTQFSGTLLGYDQTWRAKDVIVAALNYAAQTVMDTFKVAPPRQGMTQEEIDRETGKLPHPALGLQLPSEPLAIDDPNFLLFQDTFDLNGGEEGTFSFDIFFEPKSSANAIRDGATLSKALLAEREAFDRTFDSMVPLAEPYSQGAAKGTSLSDSAFARELISSALGGVGYFYGKQVVDRSQSAGEDEEVGEGFIDLAKRESIKAALGNNLRQEGPYELTTGTPGRSVFPRGFYWDEGFHLAAIGSVNNDLSLAILKSWFGLVDEDGWVGRELALGVEAASRVPEGFLAQIPLHGNPPTLTMALAMYIDRLARTRETGIGDDMLGDQLAFGGGAASADSSTSPFLQDRKLGNAYLRTLYPSLRRHYQWFRTTQKGELKEWDRTATARTEAYRWRGRSRDGHVFASGLDDYPRAPEAHSGELHLDLHCWMGFFADTMRKIAEAVGEEDDMDEYERHYEGIVANLDDLHWSEKEKMYCDVTVDHLEQSQHICHAGYVSIFPLLLGILEPSNPRLGDVLTLVRNEKEIWSDYGLLSLSKSDRHFETKEGYWRGPIWMPINYMALRSLKMYSRRPGPFQKQAGKIYEELRLNIVGNVRKEYERTGWTWEQYNATTGHGQRGHPFTGWTSLVALAMAEVY